MKSDTISSWPSHSNLSCPGSISCKTRLGRLLLSWFQLTRSRPVGKLPIVSAIIIGSRSSTQQLARASPAHSLQLESRPRALPYDHCGLTKSRPTSELRASNQDSRQKYQRTAHQDLEGSREQRGLHVTVADPSDDAQFHQDDGKGDAQRYMEVGNQKRKGVPDAADRCHSTFHQTAGPRMTSAGQASVVRQGFCEAHANTCAQGGRHAHQESVPATFRSQGGGKDRRQR